MTLLEASRFQIDEVREEEEIVEKILRSRNYNKNILFVKKKLTRLRDECDVSFIRRVVVFEKKTLDIQKKKTKFSEKKAL